ncbi:hypothetical protein [Frankia sp. AiPa1]|uniref:hypothetical protein n=1 Tax=Frankia sp. AiPa1 TaxID=573492 RepID=UPI00202B28A5|nr:hypothetical protein [Frankia sp. AiPa1]MCL9758149.1 hypothetical protein [Frankia sp. AiPa1]
MRCNLKLEGGRNRPGHLFHLLNDVTISGGPEPSSLMYHHIVPYSKLRDFWNKLVENGDLAKREFLLPLRKMIAEGTYVDILHPGGTLVDADAQQVVDLARDIYVGTVSHSPTVRSRPPGWDNLMSVYAWLPGNLFVGPAARCDDPKDKLDDASFRLRRATDVRCTRLSEANTRILGYLDGGPGRNSPSPASKALGKVVECARFQDFDDADWIWFPNKSGPQVKGKAASGRG